MQGSWRPRNIDREVWTLIYDLIVSQKQEDNEKVERNTSKLTGPGIAFDRENPTSFGNSNLFIQIEKIYIKIRLLSIGNLNFQCCRLNGYSY